MYIYTEYSVRRLNTSCTLLIFTLHTHTLKLHQYIRMYGYTSIYDVIYKDASLLMNFFSRLINKQVNERERAPDSEQPVANSRHETKTASEASGRDHSRKLAFVYIVEMKGKHLVKNAILPCAVFFLLCGACQQICGEEKRKISKIPTRVRVYNRHRSFQTHFEK